MSKPPCDYCGNPAHYMFGDGEVICSACNSRLPHSSREARKRIAELERENAELETKLAEEIRISNERGAFIENRLADMAALEAKLKIAEDAMTAVLENKGGGFAIWGPMVAAALAKIKEAS